MGMQKDRVRINVRGKIFETTATTLASVSRNSMFGAMFADEWNLQVSEVNKEYFIDRNPDCFSALLDLLGTGELHVPPNVSEKLLYREAHYYGLLDHVRTAKWGYLDCNRLRLAGTVRGQTSDNCTSIRASPDGGCAVAYKRVVRIYDWMLEEHPPINFNYQIVNDVGWINSENIVISAQQRNGREDAGIGLFSLSTGDLRHKYQINHENQVKSFSAGPICFNSAGKIFAVCKGTGTDGVGVWDQITGEQTDFFHKTEGWPRCDANRIECFNGSDCLLLSNVLRGNDKKYIKLIDFRDKSKVWSWSDDFQENQHGCGRPYASGDHDYVQDAIAMEESNAICVVNQYDDLGFVDLRSTYPGIIWISRNRIGNHKKVELHYPKLTLHEGKLFACINDSISMFSGPDWLLTSSIGRSCNGGTIRDFSIVGGRLFALHTEENVFDVWETPSPRNWSVSHVMT